MIDNRVIRGQISIQIQLIRIPYSLYVEPYSGLPIAFITHEFLKKHELRSTVVNVYPVKLQKNKVFKNYTTFKLCLAKKSVWNPVRPQEKLQDSLGVSTEWFDMYNFNTEVEEAYLKALIGFLDPRTYNSFLR